MKSNFKLIHNLLKNSKFRGYFLKCFAGVASVAFAAFSIYVIVSYSMYSVYLRDALSRFREQNLIKTSDFVDYVFDGIDQAYYLVSNSEDILKLLMAQASSLPTLRPVENNIDISAGEDEPALKKSDVTRAIDDLFKVTVLSPAMDSIYAYSNLNGYIVSWTDFRTLETFPDPEFIDIYNEGFTFFARSKKPQQANQDIITIVREITHDGQSIGVAAFNIKYNVFASLVSQSFEKLPEAICLVDKDGRVFYATDKTLLNTDIAKHPLYASPYARSAQSDGGIVFDAGRVITSVRSANGSYTVLSSAESIEISDFQRTFSRFILWGSLLGLFAAFLLAFGVSYRLYSNMIRLISFAGSPHGKKTEADWREISFITENITGLAARNSHIEYELAEKLAELKKAQSIALQNQINPHFILNTLQIVNLDILSQLKTDSSATRIISLLSEILQSNLNTTDYIVPLSYELRQAAKYIEIERIRTKERFMVEWDVDEELHQYRTVKFIIQPVLENSFKHGLTNSMGTDKHIYISARLEEQALLIVIRDNGLGITPDVLANLQSSLLQSHIQENRHIGLCNVDKRIKLVYGGAYGVNISSELGKGTEVSIRQKLVREEW